METLGLDPGKGVRLTDVSGKVLASIPFPATRSGMHRLLPVDVDGDGRLDFLVVPVSGTDPVTMLLRNRGTGLEWGESAAVDGSGNWRDAAVSDFDGDGHEDVVWVDGQGVCRVQVGDGRGGWRLLAGKESGLPGSGGVTAVGVLDVGEDGIPDLGLRDGKGRTRLFVNGRGRPGLRVRLVGRAGWRQGEGSEIRLRTGTRWGATRRVGSGATILAAPGVPTELEVRWSDGRKTTAELGGELTEVTVGGDGVMGR